MFQFNRKKYSRYTDEELVNSYRHDWHTICISILYERYGHLVMGVALKYLKDGPEAEDLTMHVFELLLAKLKVHEVQHFRSWLFMVTRNECLMHLRRLKRIVPDELEHTSSSSTDHEELELQLTLLAAKLDSLKTEQRLCIDYFYLQNKSYAEISGLLTIPITKVKSAIQNGKRNLKILLEQENEFNQ